MPLPVKDPSFSSFQFLLETPGLSVLRTFYLGISALFRFSAQGQISSSVKELQYEWYSLVSTLLARSDFICRMLSCYSWVSARLGISP